MTTEINKARCRYYSELLAKLADGTHTVEESSDDGQTWNEGARYGIMSLQIDDSELDYVYRSVEKPRTPKTVTVYVYKDKEGDAFVSQRCDLGSFGHTLIKTSTINLDDDTDSTGTQAAAKSADGGIDWNALPEEAAYVTYDPVDGWYWYSEFPRLYPSYWLPQEDCDAQSFTHPVFVGDWTKSLQCRSQKA